MKLAMIVGTLCLSLVSISGMAWSPHPGVASCDASDLSEIVGYTAVTSTNVVGEFEGADYDKPVKLDNGMIFEFTEYNYSYSYRPDVIIFARSATIQDRQVNLYKLLIADELYDVIRVR